MNPSDDTRAWPPVSVVMPVRSEERHLAAAVRCALDQAYPGEVEVVVAVGPSRDRTQQIAADLAARDARVRWVSNPSGATAAALNLAVAAAHHPIIARVDGHAILPPDYLRVAVGTLADTGADNVGGVMAAEGITPLEQAIARAMTSSFGVGHAPFHTGGRPGPADSVYLGVFLRRALERVGGFDERFVRAQDWETNHRIRQTGGTVWFTPRLRVAYRPRSSLRALTRQYFDYGRWRHVVARRHRTVTSRYLAPPTAVVFMVAGVVAALAGFPLGLAAPGTYVVTVLGASAWTGRRLPPRALVWLPVVYATMHCCWGVGFLVSPPHLGFRAKAPGDPEQRGERPAKESP
ncbi:MAG: glycosyltransferase [Streptosporangiaceae bacterium]